MYSGEKMSAFAVSALRSRIALPSSPTTCSDWPAPLAALSVPMYTIGPLCPTAKVSAFDATLVPVAGRATASHT